LRVSVEMRGTATADAIELVGTARARKRLNELGATYIQVHEKLWRQAGI
jgi:hypothetical protein